MRVIGQSDYNFENVEVVEAPGSTQTKPARDTSVVVYRPSPLETLRDVVRHRRFVLSILGTAAARHIKKYRLGPTWLLLSTFTSVFGYSFIFGGGVFHVKTPNHMPYFMYLLVGMMGWKLFQSSLNESNRSFLRLRKLSYTFHFPLILIPTAGSAYALLEFGINFTLYLGSAAFFWATKGKLYAQLSPKLLLMSVAGLGLCLAFSWAIGLWTAPLTYWARDVRMIVNFVMPFYMLLTPVMYPIDSLHGKMRILAEANPLSSAVEMAKVGLLGVGAVHFWAAIWSISIIACLFLSGMWFMTRYGSTLVTERRSTYADDTDDTDDTDDM